MLRASAIVLGVGLIILWLVGLNTHAVGWMVWLTGIGGLLSFLLAAAPVRETADNRLALLSSPGALSVGLFALWIVGLALGVQRWLVWWDFAFACAYGLLTIGLGVETTTTQRTGTPRVV